MISSSRNPKIKWIRTLQAHSRSRRQEGAFVIEGVRLAEEALASGWSARLLLYTDDLGDRGQRLLNRYAAQSTPIEQVTAQVMRAASDTQNPQGILAVLAWQPLPLPAAADLVLILDGVSDPGNLGTMLRTALAANVQAVLLPPGTADAFAPKVMRAAMGAHFHLSIHSLGWEEIFAYVEGLQVYLGEAGAGLDYTQANFRQPLTLIIGGEAEGATPQAQRLALTRVHVPMPGGGESLNAAVAAGVLLFEVVRQRSIQAQKAGNKKLQR